MHAEKNAEEEKRLFFGAEVHAPWPKELPAGRMIEESSRHITLAFLGNTSFTQLQTALPSFPAPPFKIGPVGKCDKVHFLPEEHPRVVAGHVEWLGKKEEFSSFQKELNNWLEAQKYKTDKRDFYPHITIARSPFDYKEWREGFSPLPFMITAFHLYESLGRLQYRSIWTYPLKAAFDELEHTADIAFQVRGEDLRQVHLHAQIALAFKFPPLLKFFSTEHPDSLDEVIIDLNHMIANADQKIGCPFKAVSFHGKIEKFEDQLLQWEMIVDV